MAKCSHSTAGGCGAYAARLTGERAEDEPIVYPTDKDLQRCTQGSEGCSAYKAI